MKVIKISPSNFSIFIVKFNDCNYARVAKLVDALALGASEETHEGSSPFPGTKNNEVKAKALADLFLPRKGLELNPQRSPFCSQKGEGEAGPSTGVD